MIPASLCIPCKGRLWCGLSKCPILEKFSVKQEAVSGMIGKEFEGSSPPSVFVTWTNYPNVSIAPLAPPMVSSKNASMDDPEHWFGLPQTEIVRMRSQLIQSKTKSNVNDAKNPSRILSDLQELSMSEKPVPAEFELWEKPTVNLSFHEGTAPMGPTGRLKKMTLEENVQIPKKVDYLVSDTAVKSNTAILELYENDFSVHFLTKLLSAGNLGVKNNRKLVPTRWSITAVDDNVSKYLVDESVKDCQQIGEFELYHSVYSDNRFWILLIPQNWSFEMMECWLPGSPWTSMDPEYEKNKNFNIISDFEFYSGRTNYADSITGAYYAARLAIAEHLVNRKRQATAMVFREIGSGYVSPLGVWVIRETVRHALTQKPVCFSDLKLAIDFLKTRLTVPILDYQKKSSLLDSIKNQKRLSDFA